MKIILQDIQEGNEAYLIHELARTYLRRFDDKARSLGLTRTQWKLLRYLRRNPGIRQSDLAVLMDIAPMSLVHLLDRMEKKKWVRRVPDTKDRRAKKVYLESKVDPYSARMRNLALALRKMALKDFTPEEHKKLVAFLERIRDNLAQDTE